jgi:hypothetical protein
MKNIYYLLFFGLVFTYQVSAQFENKVNTHASIGVPIFSPETGDVASEEVFAGYSSLPSFSFGLNYAFNTKFSFQSDLRLMYTTKTSVYSITDVTVDLMLKYNFVHSDKLFSPYIIGGMNIGTLYLVQQEHDEYQPGREPASVEDTQNNGVTVSQPETKFTIFPAIGITGGVGVDFTLKKKVGLFVNGLYTMNNAANHVLVKESFPNNYSTWGYFLFQVGVKFSFIKSKSI